MKRQKRPAVSETAQVLKELQDLKKLTVIQLLASGVQSIHIAKALGVGKSTISGMVPVRKIQQHLGKD